MGLTFSRLGAGVVSTPGTTPATMAVAGKGLPLYVPPASVTLTMGVAWSTLIAVVCVTVA